jgi:hypothetical protein
MTLTALACFVLAPALAGWVFMAWRGLSQDWLPEDLKAGRLVHVEEDLSTDDPYPVIGRPDQVYRLASGLHVPLELKNRDKFVVYDTDIAEISLRGWLLRKNGRPTARHGYMAINNRKDGERKAIRVELRDDAFCEQLIRRYIDVTTGACAPRLAHRGKCKSCGHNGRCHGA